MLGEPAPYLGTRRFLALHSLFCCIAMGKGAGNCCSSSETAPASPPAAIAVEPVKPAPKPVAVAAAPVVVRAPATTMTTKLAIIYYSSMRDQGCCLLAPPAPLLAPLPGLRAYHIIGW